MNQISHYLFRKEILLFIFSLLLGIILLELSALFIYAERFGKAFDRKEIFAELATDTTASEQAESVTANLVQLTDSKGVLHPYLGYVSGPENPYRNEFGFFGPNPLLKKTADKIIIGVTGGSVAAEFAGRMLLGNKSFFEALTDKKVEIVPLAFAGYKQPQQLLALTYILSLGGEFDILINLDGFNDIMIPYVNNIPANVYPAFPMNWHLHARKGFQPEIVSQIAKIQRIQEDRDGWKVFLRNSVLKHSITSLTVWKSYDNRLQNQIYLENENLQNKLTNLQDESNVLGPDFSFKSDMEIWKMSVKIWEKASLQMANLCEDNNIAYFHFLQPNQYVPDSKTFTKIEKKIAYSNQSSRLVKSVINSYPILRQAGKKLTEKGIVFTDLSMIFKNEDRTIYRDKCCHINELGNALVTKKIVSIIKTYYKSW